MSEKSLADLIIEGVPYQHGSELPRWTRLSVATVEACNDLRDELLELRDAKRRLDQLRDVLEEVGRG